MISRQVLEGKQVQGEDEKIIYSLTTTPWGANPTNVSVVVKTRQGAIVTPTVMSGSPTVAGDTISLPLLQALTAGQLYRIEIKFTSQGNTFEPYFYVQAET